VASVAPNTEIVLIGSTPQWSQFLPRKVFKTGVGSEKGSSHALAKLQNLE
jgi:hypothetical protein